MLDFEEQAGWTLLESDLKRVGMSSQLWSQFWRLLYRFVDSMLSKTSWAENTFSWPLSDWSHDRLLRSRLQDLGRKSRECKLFVFRLAIVWSARIERVFGDIEARNVVDHICTMLNGRDLKSFVWEDGASSQRWMLKNVVNKGEDEEKCSVKDCGSAEDPYRSMLGVSAIQIPSHQSFSSCFLVYHRHITRVHRVSHHDDPQWVHHHQYDLQNHHQAKDLKNRMRPTLEELKMVDRATQAWLDKEFWLCEPLLISSAMFERSSIVSAVCWFFTVQLHNPAEELSWLNRHKQRSIDNLLTESHPRLAWTILFSWIAAVNYYGMLK